LGVKLHEALLAQGVEVYDRFTDEGWPNPKLKRGTFDPKADAPTKNTNSACWVSVPSHAKRWLKGQVLSIVTMWEATKLPQTFRENLHAFDHVIVPSAHNVELFSKYHNNVSYLPLGVDPVEWHYAPRRATQGTFRFMIAGSGGRKGIDLAITAFDRLWHKEGSWDGLTPVLVLKDPKGTALELDAAAGVPRLEHIPGYVSAEEEVALYRQANCYLQPSRGEGFGLQPLQAIAQGIPTILTDAHGQAGFAHMGYPLGSRLVPADYFIHGDAGEWWEPSLDDLCDQMRYVYDNYEEALAKAALGAIEVAENWTWANTASRFIDILGDRIDMPYLGDGSWQKQDLHLFRVMVDRDMKLDAAGFTYIFEPGREYWEPADIKRILYEMNALTAECCLEDDNGLAPVQVASLGKYQASKAVCPTCGQHLNSGLKESDRIFEEMLAERALEPS
jgi:glycosyltransferase involved in cell wall biosynthesis